MYPSRKRQIRPHERLALTERDFSILWAISLRGYRFLTCRQIGLLFSIPEGSCNRRMEELSSARLVRRLYLPVIVNEKEKEPIYTIDRLGAALLARQSHLELRKLYSPIGERSYLFLAHSIEVNDFRVALEVATRDREHVRVLFWRSEKE
ncbi:MAG: replication-relaxation family protein, partial [Nitrospinota bacterium]